MNTQIFGLLLIIYLIGSTLLAAYAFNRFVIKKFGRGSIKRSLIGIASITATAYYLNGLLYSEGLLNYIQLLNESEQEVFNWMWTLFVIVSPHAVFYFFVSQRKGFRFFFGYHEDDEEFLLEEQLAADHSELLKSLEEAKKSPSPEKENGPINF